MAFPCTCGEHLDYDLTAGEKHGCDGGKRRGEVGKSTPIEGNVFPPHTLLFHVLHALSPGVFPSRSFFPTFP